MRLSDRLAQHLLSSIRQEPADVTRVLDKGAPVDAVDELGFTALATAVWRGKLEVAQLLLERGASLEAGVVAPIRLVGERTALQELLVAHGAAPPSMPPFASPRPVEGQPGRSWTAVSVDDGTSWHVRVYEGRVLVGRAGGREVVDPMHTLAAWAAAPASRPSFQAFTYNSFLRSSPITADELEALESPAPAGLDGVLEVVAALEARDTSRLETRLDALEHSWRAQIAHQRATREGCPLCRNIEQRFAFSVDREGPSKLPRACWYLIDAEAPFGGDGGEMSGPFRCWLCDTHYYHQHEYEFDPGGSWDDHYYVRLDLGEALARVRADGRGTETHQQRSARAYLRLFVYTACLLAYGT